MILVVEPDDETQDLITLWLQRDGFRVVAVDNPQDGLLLMARADARAFRGVLCAAVMPSLGVKELVERLRFLADQVPIFVMVAFDDAIPDEIASLPVQGLLKKPLVRAEVQKCLAGLSARRPGR